MNKYKIIYRKGGVKYSTFVKAINKAMAETAMIMSGIGRSDIIAIGKQ